jgi:hypothetical protein
MGKTKFQSFTDARKFVQTLGLKNNSEWKKYSKSSKKPVDIPANPSQAYGGKIWKGIPDWLGNGNLSNKHRTYLSYEKCQNVIQKLRITKQTEWEKYWKSNKKPINIPSHPDRIYKEWKGWGTFLGTGRIANQNVLFWSYEKSLKYLRLQNFKNQSEFRAAAKNNKLPKEIPKSPMTVYKNKGWISWGDWLGTGFIDNKIKSQNYLSLDKAKLESRVLAKKYNLKSHDDWIKAHQEGKIPKYLPRNPWQVYPRKKK